MQCPCTFLTESGCTVREQDGRQRRSNNVYYIIIYVTLCNILQIIKITCMCVYIYMHIYIYIYIYILYKLKKLWRIPSRPATCAASRLLLQKSAGAVTTRSCTSDQGQYPFRIGASELHSCRPCYARKNAELRRSWTGKCPLPADCNRNRDLAYTTLTIPAKPLILAKLRSVALRLVSEHYP